MLIGLCELERVRPSGCPAGSTPVVDVDRWHEAVALWCASKKRRGDEWCSMHNSMYNV